MLRNGKSLCALSVLVAGVLWGSAGFNQAAAQVFSCPVSQAQLRNALVQADTDDSSGLNNHYWAVAVNRGGAVCAVAYSGPTRDSQWLLSRQIAAAKAFTANGLALDSKPISTAALYNFVQPVPTSGNPLFGLQHGNPIDARAAYAGSFNSFGTFLDPMVGQRVGGTITFGGGLGLYRGTEAVGGLGLSGDTACADHSTAYRLRNLLNLAPAADDFGLDKIHLDNVAGHPHCPNDGDTQGTQ